MFLHYYGIILSRITDGNRQQAWKNTGIDFFLFTVNKLITLIFILLNAVD